jgi:hypothetical protein
MQKVISENQVTEHRGWSDGISLLESSHGRRPHRIPIRVCGSDGTTQRRQIHLIEHTFGHKSCRGVSMASNYTQTADGHPDIGGCSNHFC